MTNADPAAPRRVGPFRRTIRRRWGGILALGLVPGAFLAAIASLATPPVYRATAILKVEDDSEPIFAGGVTPPADQASMVKTQSLLATSPDVLSAALQDPRAQATALVRRSTDPELTLRDALDVTIQEGSHLFTLSMETEDPASGATLVNAVVSSYVRAAEAWSTEAVTKRIARLRDLQRNYEAAVEQHRGELRKLYSRAEASPTPTDLDTLPAKPRRLRDERERNALEALRIQTELDVFRGRLPQVNASVRLTERFDDLQMQLQACESYGQELEQLLAEGGDDTDETDLSLRIEWERSALESAQEYLKLVERHLNQIEYERMGNATIGVVARARPTGAGEKPLHRLLPGFAAAGLLGATLSFGVFLLVERRAARRPAPPPDVPVP